VESRQIYAVIDSNHVAGSHYKFDLAGYWQKYFAYPFPVAPRSFCRLVFDAELETLYATVGQDTNLFYARYTGNDAGGSQARTVGHVSSRLAATASSDGVLIRYALSASERVRLDVFDPVGRKVLSRDMGVQAPGEYRKEITYSELRAHGQFAHAGILLLRFSHGSETEQAKVVLF
jgi:hypothetical protein